MFWIFGWFFLIGWVFVVFVLSVDFRRCIMVVLYFIGSVFVVWFGVMIFDCIFSICECLSFIVFRFGFVIIFLFVSRIIISLIFGFSCLWFFWVLYVVFMVLVEFFIVFFVILFCFFWVINDIVFFSVLFVLELFSRLDIIFGFVIFFIKLFLIILLL